MNAAAARARAELTATAMFGLSQYSSPEMIRKAKSADGRTDVWSLGAILYELITGKPPFIGEAAMLMLQITREEPPPTYPQRQADRSIRVQPSPRRTRRQRRHRRERASRVRRGRDHHRRHRRAEATERS
jgi:serine/threonine protein kinase